MSILRLLLESVQKKSFIASQHHVKIDTGSFKKAFSQLLSLGFIEPTEKKLRSRNQAYRITAHGIDFLNNKTNRQP